MTLKAQKRRIIGEVTPLLIIIAALIVFVVMSAAQHAENSRNLKEIDFSFEKIGEEAGVATTVMRAELPEDCADGGGICFYTAYADVRVALNGETVYAFSKPAGEKLTKAAPSIWNTVSIPPSEAGSVLEIRFSSPYGKYADVRPEVLFGAEQSISRYVMMKTVPLFVSALAVMFFGLISSVIALILRFYLQKRTGLYSFSLFIMVLSVFLAVQQTTVLLMFSGRISFILIQNIAFMLCPIMYTRYLMRSGEGISRRIALGLNAVSIFNFAVILILQLCRVRDMPEMMSSTRNLCIIIVAYAFLSEMRGHRKIMIAMWAAALLYSAYRYYFSGSVPWVLYAALYLYLFLMVYRVIADIVRSRAKEIRLEAALEVSKSEIAAIQITSHFFYHTLDSIRALIRLDADRAYKMAGDFAKYIRYRVDGVERLEETVPFSREIRSIRAYTDIKQAQLGDRFSMIFDVETEDFDILPLTVQPLVENAVIHAVQKRREGGEVRLICRENKNGYHIEVVDNGPGPDAQTAEPSSVQQSSTAVKNVNTRLEYYGIAPLKFTKNEFGGYTVSLDTPKTIKRKETNP